LDCYHYSSHEASMTGPTHSNWMQSQATCSRSHSQNVYVNAYWNCLQFQSNHHYLVTMLFFGVCVWESVCKCVCMSQGLFASVFQHPTHLMS
jgi:cytochrome c oxidase subunit IV